MPSLPELNHSLIATVSACAGIQAAFDLIRGLALRLFLIAGAAVGASQASGCAARHWSKARTGSRTGKRERKCVADALKRMEVEAEAAANLDERLIKEHWGFRARRNNGSRSGFGSAINARQIGRLRESVLRTTDCAGDSGM